MRVKMWHKGKGTPVEVSENQVKEMEQKGWKTTKKAR